MLLVTGRIARLATAEAHPGQGGILKAPGLGTLTIDGAHLPLRHVEDHVDLPRLLQHGDGFLGGDHLIVVHRHARDHPVIGCLEIGVAELVLRLGILGLRRLEFGLRLIEACPTDGALLHRVLHALVGRLRQIEAGAGIVELASGIAIIQARDQLALLDLLTGLDLEFTQLTADTERQVGALRGLDHTGVALDDTAAFIRQRQQLDRMHLLLLQRRLFLAAGRKPEGQHESGEQLKDAASPPGERSTQVWLGTRSKFHQRALESLE